MASEIPSSNSEIDLLLNCCIEELDQNNSQSSSESSSEDENCRDEEKEAYDPANYMLNGLRKQINTLNKFAKETISKCETEESQNKAVHNLESHTLNLLRREHVFLETLSICCGIVDDVMEDDEKEEDEAIRAIESANKISECGDHNIEVKLPRLIPELPSMEVIMAVREKMNKMLDDRLKSFEDTLTDDKLKQHSRFISLQEQIALGKEEFQANYMKKLALDKELKDAGDDDEKVLQILLNSNKDRFDIHYDEEVYDDDESSLPSIDPITRKPIFNPVRNSHCNHVFEKSSIMEFIHKNSDTAKCPLQGCRNPNVIKKEDFKADDDFTRKIRAKNQKLKLLS